MGSLFASFILAFVYHVTMGSNRDVADASCDSITDIWSVYTQKLKDNGVDAGTVQCIGKHAVGVAGCEVIRTSLGFAGDRVTPISDPILKTKAEERQFQVGEFLVRGWQDSGDGIGILISVLQALK